MVNIINRSTLGIICEYKIYLHLSSIIVGLLIKKEQPLKHTLKVCKIIGLNYLTSDKLIV